MKQPVLFIGGLGRSGSTLIERLLNEYPDVFAIGESVHIWERGLRDNELCGCGVPFDRCVFW
ncbi:MAG: sulfotransferase, partial [Acidimicrobiia bacterium]|nr:sulfotransferase [Acidimicrobiia bacterium]